MQEVPRERLILLAENNPERANLIEKAFLESSLQYKIITYSCGREIIDFLRDRESQVDTLPADLIVLDINIPGENGKEILSEIKANSKLKRIPIVVLTPSSGSEDILSSYRLQGNCYVIKSSDPHDLFAIVKRIEEFWLQIVTLPTR